MTWQLGCFAILLLALAGGFAWYERTRPDARIVALVGTLAAFAALGRIAFAALPNVKPTTDIVLISGYALGGGPGFVVGALAGLTSNFFFGQGPWTPWQMAAWGATGVLGAALALATHRRIGRLPLAIVCGLCGFAFTALQDFGDWVTYSDHSLAQLGVYVGKGVGFDAVHAAGCVAFALVFGPALARSIQRFARRLQVSWVPVERAVGVIIAITLAAALAGTSSSARAANTPTSYLRSAQNSDGGFGPAVGSASSGLFSGWAALGLAAAGYNPLDVRHGGASAIAYIGSGAGSLSDPGSLERTILAVRAVGLSVTSFAGHDLIAALEREVRSDGSVADQVNLTSFAVLALRAAGQLPSGSTWRWLRAQQDRDGGFNFATGGGSSDVDDTGAALEALAAGGSGAAHSRGRAIAFIRGQQNRDGGFPSQPGADSNAQSTAWAVQGLLAAGVNPAVLHRRGAVSPLQYLRSLIGSDGHVRYSRSSDQTPVWVTAQAVMALAGKPLPLTPVARKRAAQHAVHTTAGPALARTSRPTRPARARQRRVHRTVPSHHHPPRQARPSLDRLAVATAILTAVALAPIDVG